MRLFVAKAIAVVLCCVGLCSAAEVKRADLKPGLLFSSTDDSGVVVTRLEPSIGLTLNAGEATHPTSTGGARFTWQGYIQIVSAGKYTFEATVCGDFTWTVDGRVLLKDRVVGEAKQITGAAVELTPGLYPIEATLLRTGKAAQAQLRWTGPRFRTEPIPHLFFGHLPGLRPIQFAADVQKEHGRYLFEELACIKCHTPGEREPFANGLAARSGPNLSKIAERANTGWLEAWLKNPKMLRPHTSMPKMFADDDLGTAQRYAVVQYLTSLGKPLAEQPVKKISTSELKASVERGAKAYLLVGCATCHGEYTPGSIKKKPGDEDDEAPAALDVASSIYGVGTTTGAQIVYTLGAVGSKTTPGALAKWLKDPLATNPHTRMPNMRLDDELARDLAQYLCQTTDHKIAAKPATPEKYDIATLADADTAASSKALNDEQKWIAAGKWQFTNKGCIHCHAVDGTLAPVEKPAANSKLSKLPKLAETTCLAEKAEDRIRLHGGVDYGLSVEQRAALVAFVQAGFDKPSTPSPLHTSRVALKRFGCLNCHQREKEGGLAIALADSMKALESAENVDEVQPPQLTGVGGKLRTSWLQGVLLAGKQARPWMNLRMPQYGEANLGKLHDHLPLLEGQTTDDRIGKVEFTKEKIETGRALIGKAGHGCISCHDISGQRGGGTRGPDLAMTNQRVRYDWYYRWMHQPQRLAPGTKMPTAFLDGQALLTDYYAGDGDKQIDAMWAYTSLGPGLRLPIGVEPPKGLVIAVKDKPELLRTFMPDDAGTKCIAVGYPGGFNVVFDSSQCRLAYAWSGNFLDVSTVWNERGGSPAKLLGMKFWQAPPGHPWALTKPNDVPDFTAQSQSPAFAAKLPEGTAYKGQLAVKFRGYRLDSQGQPTFNYIVAPDTGGAALQIEETPQANASTIANGFVRTFKLDAPKDRAVWLNVTSCPTEPKFHDDAGNAIPGPVPKDTSGLKLVVANPTTEVYAASAGVWVFAKRGNSYDVLLRLHDGASAKVVTAELKMWALPRVEPALIKELK